MKFSYSWLASYLPGPAPDPKALGDRLTAVGFIVEGVEGEGAGTVYDVEITANRPDGMNHRGLAREAAVAMRRPFAEPAAAPLPEGATPADARARVFVEEPALCPRYSARVIEGIRVRPASAAVRERLAALGLGSDLGARGRHEPRALGHRSAASRVRPRHPREGERRPPDDRRPAREGGGDARDARRRDPDAHGPASRDRRRREARRPRRSHGGSRDGDLTEDDARASRGSAFRAPRRAADGAFPRDAHRRLSSLRAGNGSRGDARRSRPGRAPHSSRTAGARFAGGRSTSARTSPRRPCRRFAFPV